MGDNFSDGSLKLSLPDFKKSMRKSIDLDGSLKQSNSLNTQDGNLQGS